MNLSFQIEPYLAKILIFPTTKIVSVDLNYFFWSFTSILLIPMNLSSHKYINIPLFCQNRRKKVIKFLRFLAIFGKKWTKKCFLIIFMKITVFQSIYRPNKHINKPLACENRRKNGQNFEILGNF